MYMYVYINMTVYLDNSIYMYMYIAKESMYGYVRRMYKLTCQKVIRKGSGGRVDVLGEDFEEQGESTI